MSMTKTSFMVSCYNTLLCSKGDGERAMLEASNELRVVRDELENLMDIISTKVCYRTAGLTILWMTSEF